jgi:hypothetical protein
VGQDGILRADWKSAQRANQRKRGIRKIRVGLSGRGKRGGARVIYFWAVRKDLILLLYAYPKNVTADLSPKQVAQLAKAVKEEFGNEAENV